jgi:hypothetical protein
MDVVLNQATGTVHLPEQGSGLYESACGATFQVPEERLQVTSLSSVREQAAVTKCGRCFEDGGGY